MLFRFNRVSTWIYILAILALILFIFYLIPPRKESFEGTPGPTPIENAGYGPFDYGLDTSTVKLSDSTVKNIGYMNDQKKKAEAGNFNTNMFSYLGS